MAKTTEPLPCPFCGDTPRVGPLDPRTGGDGWGWVKCVNTKCFSKPLVENYSEARGSVHGVKAVAIYKWNRRPFRRGT